MLIKIINSWGTIRHNGCIDHEIGLKHITGSFGRTYKVLDKQLFFLSVIKYGIQYKYICEAR